MKDIDIKNCEEILWEIKDFISSNSDRFATVVKLHHERVKLFHFMRDALTDRHYIAPVYRSMLNFIDCLDVMMEDEGDISEDMYHLLKDMDKMLGVKKN